MTDAVCRHFDVASPPDLPPVIYESPVKVMREIAQLARIVVDAASAGDAVALSILDEAARELARAVVAVIERLELQHETFRVAYVGGVFEAGEVVVAPMGEAIKAVAPRAFVAPPLNPPVIGAAKLALSSCEQKQPVVR
jgi:N-acetylglucosamine kinase-like BadF-type ATPase